MHDTLAVQVVEAVEQLSRHLQHLLLLEDCKALLETAEGILSVFEYQVEMRLTNVAMVKFDDVLMIGKRKDFDLSDQILPHLPGMGKSDCLFRQQQVTAFLLNQRDEGVRSYSDGSDAIEEEGLGVGRRGRRWWISGLAFQLLGGLLQHVLVLISVTRNRKTLAPHALALPLHHFKFITWKEVAKEEENLTWEYDGGRRMNVQQLPSHNGHQTVHIKSYKQIMDPIAGLPTSSLLTLPSALTVLDHELPLDPIDSAQRFDESLIFVRSLLAGWGMSFGQLPFTPQNQATLQCLMELAEQRRKQMQLRSRSKDQLSAMQFERDKYHSFLEQARRALQEHGKRIGRWMCYSGRLQNQNNDLRMQMKKNQSSWKKQREEQRKVAGGLRAKNEHMIHELKKRDQQMARLKDQLKKNDKVAVKSSFEVYHPIVKSTSAENNSSSCSDQRFGFLLERNQRQLAMALQENTILKQKLTDARQYLEDFRKWVDVEVFGQEQTYSNPYPLQHVLFGKDNLNRELQALLQSIKDAVAQLRDICRGKTPPKRKEQPEVNFKRKISCRQQAKQQKGTRCSPIKPHPLPQQNKVAKITLTRKGEQPHNQNQTPRSSLQLPIKEQRTEPPTKIPQKHQKISLTDLKKLPSNKTTSLLCTPRAKPSQALTERLSDELSEISSHDLSIVSHLSIEQVGNGGHGWEELYQEDE